MTASDTDDCADRELMLHGFLDGELDAAHTLQFEQHLVTCERCAAALQKLRAQRSVIGQPGARWRAPDHLRAQILQALDQEGSARRSPLMPPHRGFQLLQFIKQWSFVPSIAVLAASVVLVLTPPRHIPSIQDEIIASHVRSMLANHLTDVATSDQHTVKPWFNGKIDFSPPVVDLAPEGFPLVGGRVDYVGGRVVAALVYRRQGHVINVFIRPSGDQQTPVTTGKEGYNLVSWMKDGLSFSAISDVSAAELGRLRDQFVEHASN